MRSAFSESLVRVGLKDPRMLLLTGDHGYALFDQFRKACPAQYINVGIAEQNMVGVAAGLARAGFRPFVYGLSAFVPVRVLEQIKLDVAHDNLPVVFVGDGAGFVYSHLGSSHHSMEDIACARAIPHLSVYSPADRLELELTMDRAYAAKAPVYIRLGKADRGDVHASPISSSVESILNLRVGKPGDVAFLATGSLVSTAVHLADTVFTGASVWSVPCLKPIDAAQLKAVCRDSRALVTLEEHSVFGGLGSIVAEVSTESTPRRILRVGVSDRFSELCGSYEYLLCEHGLDAASVKRRIDEFLASL